ncbi:MAG: ATP-binding protein, partial [Gemmatimonadota bacterium]|nr:ATP-binding protein [Gemmatimonadota bacterium]
RIVEAVSSTILAVDLHGRITSVNRPDKHQHTLFPDGSAQHERRQPRDSNPGADPRGPAVVGAMLRDMLAEAGRDPIDRAMASLRTGRAQSVEWAFTHRAADGDRTFLLQATPLTDQATVTGFCFSIVDITASHRSHQALADAGIALARLLSLDRVYQEIVQQARHVLSAEAVILALSDDETAALRIDFQSGIADAPSAVEERLRPGWIEALGDGKVVVAESATGAELTTALATEEGTLGVMTVIVPRPESDARVEEAQELLPALARHAAVAIERAWQARRAEQRRRLEAIGEIAAGIGHELRNPLFGISSAAQLLRFSARDDPVIEKNIGRIIREVERLNRMTASLLEYAHPHPIRLVTADPDGVWDTVLEAERGRLETRAISLVRTRPRAPARCGIDAEQLSQAFSNILVNAIEAAREATDISLTTEVLPTSAWRCRLRNAGPAIAPDAVARAFEIFHSSKPGRAGFGLPLAQRIIDEHGGTISLASDSDSGTTVTIVLPPAA